MKVGYFVSEFPYSNSEGKIVDFGNYPYGGSVVAAYNLATSLANREIEIVIFTRSKDSKKCIEKHGRVSVYRYGTTLSLFRQCFSLGMIFEPLFIDVDLIHMHTGGHISTHLSTLLYKKVRKKPLVITYHGDYQHWGGFFIRTLIKAYNGLQDKLLRNADVIISVSKNYMNGSPVLRKYKNKTVVIPNGINLKEYDVHISKDECRKKLDLPSDKRIVLFLSAIREKKAPDLLIRAMPKVLKSVPEAYLVMAGKGRMKNNVKQLAKELGINNSVEFPGFIEEDKKPLYYKAADVFVLPSHDECFPVVNLEAMACGTPVIATRVGGNPEAIQHGENGLLVPPGDLDALAEAIIYLLENEEERKKMGENARKKAKNYSWGRIAEQTEKIYKGVIEND